MDEDFSECNSAHQTLLQHLKSKNKKAYENAHDNSWHKNSKSKWINHFIELKTVDNEHRIEFCYILTKLPQQKTQISF